MNRISASVFVCNSKAYIGLGRDTQSNAHYYDFWEFDPSNNNWVQKSNFPGVARRAAITFSINNIGYIGNGYNNAPLFDFWKYDPVLNSWASIPPCPVLLYSDPGGFQLAMKGIFVWALWYWIVICGCIIQI
jgi:N-acetylneuraminic acid mutarotase